MGKKLLILCFIATTFIFLAGCKSKTDFIGQKVSEASYVPNYNFRLLNVNDIQSVCYGEGLGFVAVGKNGGILFSENGQNWKPVGISDDDLNSVCATANGFVTVGDNGYILHSKDGVNWERKSEKTIRFNLLSVAGTDSGYVAAGEFGSIYYSKDGQTWEKKAGNLFKFSVPLHNVFADKLGFIVSSNEGMILSSKNGVDWQIAQTNNLTRSIRSSYSNSKGHIAIGHDLNLFSFY